VIDDLIHLILGLELATRALMPALPTSLAPLPLTAHQLLGLRTRLRPAVMLSSPRASTILASPQLTRVGFGRRRTHHRQPFKLRRGASDMLVERVEKVETTF
jgi:hypothetical protein